MCDAAARIGSRDRLMNDGRRLRWRGNGFGIDGDIAEQQIRLGGLEIVDPAQPSRHVARQGQDRRMVARCFVKAGDKVGAAGTGRARAYAEAAGQLRLPRRGECRSLFMADADPLYLLAPANRIAQRVEGIADQAEDLPNPNLFEHADQDVRYHLSHLLLLLKLGLLNARQTSPVARRQTSALNDEYPPHDANLASLIWIMLIAMKRDRSGSQARRKQKAPAAPMLTEALSLGMQRGCSLHPMTAT